MAVEGSGFEGVFWCRPSPAEEPAIRHTTARDAASGLPRDIQAPFERSVPPTTKPTEPPAIDARQRLPVLARTAEALGEAGDRLCSSSPGVGMADDGLLKRPVPQGACGFESHPGHVYLAHVPS